LAKITKAIAAIENYRGESVEASQALASGVAALICLGLKQNEEAIRHSANAVRLLDVCPHIMSRTPEQLLYAHALALRANGRAAEGDECLRRAHERVAFVADRLDDEIQRRSWLENVLINRLIVRDGQRLSPLPS